MRENINYIIDQNDATIKPCRRSSERRAAYNSRRRGDRKISYKPSITHISASTVPVLSSDDILDRENCNLSDPALLALVCNAEMVQKIADIKPVAVDKGIMCAEKIQKAQTFYYERREKRRSCATSLNIVL